MCDFIITDEEIKEAEQDIFNNGEHFNDEQKVFIKCLDSCCVQAYAGTGKTSSIVGKLHVLAQKNVWQNGRGICVISHTNVAVDEIKNYVAKHYPAVMEYPNYIGTIQEFVNKFLFIPYLASQGLKIKFQDESYKYSPNWSKLNLLEDKNRKAINQAVKIFEGGDNFSKIFLVNSCPNFASKPFPLESVNKKRKDVNKIVDGGLSEINKYFTEVVAERRSRGLFLFDESFVDSFEYLQQNQILRDIISRRFQFVFLDEAQDCSKVQLDLLEELFSNNAQTVFQQIGDTNQAISETEWVPNESYLSLSQSTRFGDNIAEFINKFKIDSDNGVSGKIGEKTEKYLIIYDKSKGKDVLQKFAEILKDKNIPTDKDFFAISHKHEQLEIYSNYFEKTAKNKNKKTSYRFDEDIDYINLVTKEALQEQGSNLISRIFFSLLYKYFKIGGNSWSELKEHLQTSEKINDFKKLVVEVSMDVLQNEKIIDLNGLKDSLNTILGEDKINFTDSNNQTITIQDQARENKFSHSGININIGTIHSVKGQTHNATLYFSNCYGEKERKSDLQKIFANTPKVTLEFKRLLYVASSRPKYLFALAIEKSSYESLSLTDNSCFSDFETITI